MWHRGDGLLLLERVDAVVPQVHLGVDRVELRGAPCLEQSPRALELRL